MTSAPLHGPDSAPLQPAARPGRTGRDGSREEPGPFALLVAQMLQPPVASRSGHPPAEPLDSAAPSPRAGSAPTPQLDVSPEDGAALGSAARAPETLATAATILSLARLMRPIPALAAPDVREGSGPASTPRDPAQPPPPARTEPEPSGPAVTEVVRRSAGASAEGSPPAEPATSLTVSGSGPQSPQLYPPLGAPHRDPAPDPKVAATASVAAPPPEPTPTLPRGDHVVIRFTGDHGLEGTVRVAVRGHTIHATILSSDAAAAQRMRDQLGALRQSLESHGFHDTRLAIHYLSAGDGGAPATGRDRGPPTGPEAERQDSGEDHGPARRFRRDPDHPPEAQEKMP